MNESARKPLPSGMMLSSEEHARRAEAYAIPDPDLTPELALQRQLLAYHFMALSKLALRREQALGQAAPSICPD